jgi:ATP-dependent Lon protease
LDEHTAYISPHIVQENEMLLSSGLWGLGSYYYIPPTDTNKIGQVWLHEFRPFQLANVDIEYFKDCRSFFSTSEWVDLIVSSMGFNHRIYNERQKILLISRLIPLVEPRYNLVELAPKGTGKSFVYENMSRYVAVRSGSITPAVLFFNDARKTPGLITRYDCVVIDEAQKVKGDSSGELTALLKSYLEAGRFGRGSADSIAAEAGIVILANIELDHNKRPLHEDIGLFKIFPNFLRETAFIDRFSGFLPGWFLPRISKQTPSQSLGLKGDIFGEMRIPAKSISETRRCRSLRPVMPITCSGQGDHWPGKRGLEIQS